MALGSLPLAGCQPWARNWAPVVLIDNVDCRSMPNDPEIAERDEVLFALEERKEAERLCRHRERLRTTGLAVSGAEQLTHSLEALAWPATFSSVLFPQCPRF
jgi:hypothetical protein